MTTRSQRHMRFHLSAAAAVILGAVLLNVSATEWALLAVAIGLVLTAESFNTALERLADRVTGDLDPLIRDAKDMAAAGVLGAAITALAVGLLVFLPKLPALFQWIAGPIFAEA